MILTRICRSYLFNGKNLVNYVQFDYEHEEVVIKTSIISRNVSSFFLKLILYNN